MRFRPRFSLRTMFVIVTIFAALFALFAWISWNAWQVRQRQAFSQRFDMEEINGIRRIRFVGEEARVPLIWAFFGARPEDQLCLSREKYTDDEIRQIESLFPEADIFVSAHHSYDLPPSHWGARLNPDNSK